VASATKRRASIRAAGREHHLPPRCHAQASNPVVGLQRPARTPAPARSPPDLANGMLTTAVDRWG